MIKATLYRSILFFMSLLVLASCGGSSSGSASGTTTPPIGAYLSIAITNAQGQSISSSEAAEVVYVDVTAKNDFGREVSGITVTFATDIGIFSQSTALTASNGKASVRLITTVSQFGVANITATATVDSVALSKTAVLNITEPTLSSTSVNLSLLDSTCTTTTATVIAGQTLCLKASVYSGTEPQQGIVVSFSSDKGTLRPTSSLTDSTGVATAFVDSTTAALGAATVTAATTSASDNKNFQYITATSSNTTVTLNLLDQSCLSEITTRQAGETFCLKARLLQDNIPSAAQIITFAAPLGTLRQTSVLTDQDGYAISYLDSATTDIGAEVVSATFSAITDTKNYQFTPADPQQQTVVTLTILDSACQTEVISTIAGQNLCLKATLHRGSVPLVNEIVTFAATLGTLEKPSALTDSNGEAKVLLQSTIAQLGAATATASYNQLAASQNYELISTTLTLTTTIYASDCVTAKNSFSAGASFCISASLLDGNTGVANEIITFNSPLGNQRQTTALTDQAGIAKILVDSGANELGAANATATFANLVGSANYELISANTIPTQEPQLTLVTVQNNQYRNRFKAGESIQMQATLIDGSGSPVVDAILHFSAERGLLTSDAALTDGNGQAQVTLTAALTDIGAAAGTVQATVAGVTYTQSYNYEILSADAVELDSARIGYFNEQKVFVNGLIGTTIGAKADGTIVLSAGGTMGLTIVVVDQNDQRIITPTPVTFSSTCHANNKTNLDVQVTTINGEARSTYEDLSCATANGNEDILVATITVNNVALIATRNIVLLPEDIGSISFISADPTSIVLKGTGGLGKQETSTLTFAVKGVLGNPLTQQEVTFSLDTSIGGLSISPLSSLTNSQGLVTTKVTSGSVSTAVRVTATTIGKDNNRNDIEIRTQSDVLSVHTGLPDQNSITLSTELLNPEANAFNGQEVTITAFMADTFNNPVPDGTTVNFTTEGGFIDGTCNTSKGSCNVKWIGVEERVPNHRITILARAIGQETFFDVNGNNNFDDADGDSGDILTQPVDSGLDRGLHASKGFVDMSEAWRDDNENRQWDSGEQFFDYNNDGSFNVADRFFNGPNCTHSSLCAPELTRKIEVRKAIVMIMSGSNPIYTLMTDELTPGTNSNLAHLGNRHVIATNDTENGVIVDGGVTVDATGTHTNNTGNIVIADGYALSFVLVIADDALGLGQILPKDTLVTVSANRGDVSGTSIYRVPNSLGYLNHDGRDQYGGNEISFGLSNTLVAADQGEGLLTVSFRLPSSDNTFSFSVPIYLQL